MCTPAARSLEMSHACCRTECSICTPVLKDISQFLWCRIEIRSSIQYSYGTDILELHAGFLNRLAVSSEDVNGQITTICISLYSGPSCLP
jgi:hypothetical protein